MKIEECWTTLPAETGTMRLFTAAPENASELPGLLICHSFVGITDWRLEMARSWAGEGFVVALPDLFHRLGEMVSFSLPAQVSDAAEAAGSLSFFDMVSDTRSVLNALRVDYRVRSDRLGVIGGGMGGTVAFIAACAHRDLRAASIAYSRNIVTSAVTVGRPISPLFQAETLACPMQFISSSGDPVPSPTDVEVVAAHMRKYGKDFEFEIHEATPPVGHAFMEFDIPDSYDEGAAAWARTRQLSFLNRHLAGDGKAN